MRKQIDQIVTSLDKRRCRNCSPWPDSYWKSFLLIAVNLVIIAFLLFDAPVAAFASYKSRHFILLGDTITDLGKSGWIMAAAAMLFLQAFATSFYVRSIRARYRALQVCHLASYLFLSIALSGLIANLLKRSIGRARPEHFADWGISGFLPFAGNSRFESFPSGHSTTIGALFMALAILMPRFRVILLTVGIWFGMSRIIVDAHYPSDVIAGLSFGAWFSLMTAIVFSRYGLLFRISENGFPKLRRSLIVWGETRPIDHAVRQPDKADCAPDSGRPTIEKPGTT